MSDSDGGTLAAIVPNAIRRKHARKLGVVFLLVAVVLSAGGAYMFVQTDQVATQVDGLVAQQTEQQMEFSADSQARELSRVAALLREESRLLSDKQTLKENTCSTVGDCAVITSTLRTQIDEGFLPTESVLGMHYVAVDDRSIEGTDGDGGPVLVDSTLQGFEGNEPDELGVPWGQALADGDLFAAELQDPSAAYISQPWTFGPEGGERTVFAVISRVPAQDRLLVVMVDAEALSDSITSQTDSGFAAVVDSSSGKTVLSQREATVGTPIADLRTTETDTVAEAGDSGSGYTTADVDGTSYAVGYAAVDGTDWVVESYQPRQEAFAVSAAVADFTDTVRANILALLGAAILALGAVVFTVGRRTSRELATLSARAEELEQGDLDADFQSSRVDEFGRLYGAFSSMRDSLRDRIEEVQRAREETERMNTNLETSAADYSDVMQRCAAGDFSARMDADVNNEAMRTVAREFNQMMDELEATTANLRAFAAEVADETQQVTASVEEVRNASERVSTSTQGISEGTERQRESFETVSDEVSGLSSTIEEISASADEVARIAQQSAEVGQDGREQAQEAIARMNTVAAEARDALEKFERLESELDRVEELTDAISEFAEQTNVLALNANIEATRGSENGGEGFGVVAEEIKELAGESKAAAEEADELIASITTQTAATATAVEETTEAVEDSVGSVEDVARSLSEVADYADETYAGISEVDEATDRQADSAQEVLEQVTDAARISDQTADDAEDVAAAAEEQVAALTTVTDRIEELADRASRLSESLGNFETRSPEEIGGGDVDVGVAPDGGAPNGGDS